MRKPNDQASSRPGFSLVELLTVIVVVGVLASMLIVVVGKVRVAAESSQCVSNLRQLHAGALLLIADSDYRMPDKRMWAYDKGRSSSAYAYQLAPYLGLRAGSGDWAEATVMTCPGADAIVSSDQPWRRTYSINLHACSTSDGIPMDEQWYPQRIQQIEYPVEMALFLDGAVNPSGSGSYWTNVKSSQIDPAGGGAPILYPHGNALNVVFVDGHVAQLTLSEMLARYADPYSRFWRYNGGQAGASTGDG